MDFSLSCVAGCKVVDDSAEAGLSEVVLTFAALSSSSSDLSSSESSSSESSSESDVHFTSSSCSVATAPVCCFVNLCFSHVLGHHK